MSAIAERPTVSILAGITRESILAFDVRTSGSFSVIIQHAQSTVSMEVEAASADDAKDQAVDMMRLYRLWDRVLDATDADLLWGIETAQRLGYSDILPIIREAKTRQILPNSTEADVAQTGKLVGVTRKEIAGWKSEVAALEKKIAAGELELQQAKVKLTILKAGKVA